MPLPGYAPLHPGYKTNKSKKGSGNADKRSVETSAPAGAAAPVAGARLSAFHHGSRRPDFGPDGSAPGQASWDAVRTGVTRPFLSQSSGSTPRTGRSTGEHDAQSRPGTECMAPRAGTALAPLSGVPSRRRPLLERDSISVTEIETNVNVSHLRGQAWWCKTRRSPRRNAPPNPVYNATLDDIRSSIPGN
jgi:hypothetical protein